MDIKVGLTVNGQWIKADTIMLVSSSVNIYHCSFDFSKEWEPYTKTAVFCLNSGDPIETPVDNNNTPNKYIANTFLFLNFSNTFIILFLYFH